MWTRLATFILRRRAPLLIGLAVITGLMAWKGQDARLMYKFGGLLPEDDPTYVDYQEFLSQFGEEDNVVALGVDGNKIGQLDIFQAWWNLNTEIDEMTVWVDSAGSSGKVSHQISVADSIFGLRSAALLVRDDEFKRFRFERLIPTLPVEQSELDSVWARLKSQPFYEGLLFKEGPSNVSLQLIYVNPLLFNSDNRGDCIAELVRAVERFEAATGVDIHISGLPFIRTEITQRIKGEGILFVALAAAVTAFLLLLFFRSFLVMAVSLLVVGTGVVFSLGTIALFDYPITALMGLIPPLMIVIGVPNCIYLLNKYHAEYKRHGNKARSLTRVVQKVGNATFMTNTTTALGFAAFIFTDSDILKQFGVVASINIMAVFVISILIIPAVFSWLPAPRPRQIGHLDRQWVFQVVSRLELLVLNHRRAVYWTTVLVLIVGGYGISQVRITGNIADDLPREDTIIQDLRWFETEFGGVMPFEVIIHTDQPGAVTQLSFLKKLERLQKVLAQEPNISKSVSLADGWKLARQGFYQGNPAKFGLPNRREQSFMAPYLKGDIGLSGQSRYVDIDRSRTRVSAQIADIGTHEMTDLLSRLRPQIDEIFPPEKYRVVTTGTSVVFVEGTNYLVHNLFTSLALAIFVIALGMAILFGSTRMVAISLLPNLIPLVFTAAVMGYFGIGLKPSTLLVFSIAFGISIDDTIHLLAKYRQELDLKGWNMREAVLVAVRETGVSMMYTSIVLFFGFLMFAASDFEGTRSLGLLVSATLLVAMLANLVLLPSLLLGFERYITAKTFHEPLLEILDEEEDLDLGELMVGEHPGHPE
jgi:hypothetical protein